MPYAREKRHHSVSHRKVLDRRGRTHTAVQTPPHPPGLGAPALPNLCRDQGQTAKHCSLRPCEAFGCVMGKKSTKARAFKEFRECLGASEMHR